MGLSPDGRMALAIAGEVPNQRFVLYPIGAGEPRSIPLNGLRVQMGAWFPDGRRIIFAANEPDRGARLWVQGIDEPKPKAISPEGYRMFGNAVSPDGRFVIAQGPDQRYYIYPVEGGEPKPIPGLAPGDIPEGWSGGDDTVYLRRRGEVPNKVLMLDLRTGRKELWKELVPQDAAGVSGIGPVWVTRDRRWYAYSYIRSLADLYVMEDLK